MTKFKLTRIITPILLFTVWIAPFGQKISVDTFFIPRIEKFSTVHYDKLKFPLIKTGNLQVEKAINNDLKNRFTNYEYPNLTIDSSLSKWSEGIIYLDFEVTYLKDGLISLNISSEGCGAYCTSWTDYFTYNYITGQFLTIDKIIDITGNFKSLVTTDKVKQYEQQKVELKEIFLDKNSELDEDSYKWVLEQFENCDKEFTLKSFALHTDYLEIIENCYLPNSIKNLTPTIILKYKYFDIKKDLKIKT